MIICTMKSKHEQWDTLSDYQTIYCGFRLSIANFHACLEHLNCIILMHFNLNMLKSCTSTVTWPRLQCKHVFKHYFNRSQKYPHLIMFKMSNRLARLLSIVVACTYIHVVAIFSCTWLTDLCIFSIPWQHISLS